eukprot:30018-Pelagococcus_subviridis.AAC.2
MGEKHRTRLISTPVVVVFGASAAWTASVAHARRRDRRSALKGHGARADAVTRTTRWRARRASRESSARRARAASTRASRRDARSRRSGASPRCARERLPARMKHHQTAHPSFLVRPSVRRDARARPADALLPPSDLLPPSPRAADARDEQRRRRRAGDVRRPTRRVRRRDDRGVDDARAESRRRARKPLHDGRDARHPRSVHGHEAPLAGVLQDGRLPEREPAAERERVAREAHARAGQRPANHRDANHRDATRLRGHGAPANDGRRIARGDATTRRRAAAAVRAVKKKTFDFFHSPPPSFAAAAAAAAAFAFAAFRSATKSPVRSLKSPARAPSPNLSSFALLRAVALDARNASIRFLAYAT